MGAEMCIRDRYVIGTDGVIQFSYVHPVYSVRLDMEVLLAAAKAAASEG